MMSLPEFMILSCLSASLVLVSVYAIDRARWKRKEIGYQAAIAERTAILESVQEYLGAKDWSTSSLLNKITHLKKDSQQEARQSRLAQLQETWIAALEEDARLQTKPIKPTYEDVAVRVEWNERRHSLMACIATAECILRAQSTD